MAADGWERRMAERAAARDAAGPLEPVDACEIGDPDMPPGHEAHHGHVYTNYSLCSCGGADLGSWSIAYPPEAWADGSTYFEDLRREMDARACSVCGAKGVEWTGDFFGNAKDPAPAARAVAQVPGP